MPARATPSSEPNDPAAVSAFLASCPHPLLPVVRAVRTTLLTAVPVATEGIKWNAPSFHCGEWFATFHLRRPREVQLVLHRGAKVRSAPSQPYVDDPTGMLQWKSTDRAIAVFRSLAELEAHTPAFTAILQAWAARLRDEVGPTSH
ncbi:DUF1801 domain-containing protein [Actomonas aquatica]|uniref:DUF1801 domain-containing protein n=1 Tax=Actomonas aquatica TaxID=2866162 RepID=A0ABZ1C6V9_9BACT|nr:DUF1801 domain-containing protein [Opitutus sp. WL0086]WRQ87449.1 DUF1801 domain-containing protein [Opitutus sp. WL0086]